MWQRKHAGLTMDPPTLVYCREHYPNYFGVIVETLNGPDGFIPPTKTWFTRKEHPWPEPPMTPSVNNEDMGMTPPVNDEDMGLKSTLPDEPSHKANQKKMNVVNGTGLNFAPKCDNF